MATATDITPISFTEFHLFAGIGGGSMGSAKARASWNGVNGHIRNIGAVDCDPFACEDYRNLTGSPITCLDLFDRAQYEAFHGKQPLALQSAPVRFPDGRPVVLVGNSDAKWRERIGNMVPPMASQRIHEQIVLALLQNALGETFTLGATPIWVKPVPQLTISTSQAVAS